MRVVYGNAILLLAFDFKAVCLTVWRPCKHVRALRWEISWRNFLGIMRRVMTVKGIFIMTCRQAYILFVRERVEMELCLMDFALRLESYKNSTEVFSF